MYAQMFDAVDIGLVAIDPDFSVVDWNMWMANQTNLSKEAAIGRNLYDMYPELRTPWFERNCRSVLKFGNYSFFSQKLHGYCIPIKRKYTVARGFTHMQQNCTLGPLRDKSKAVTGLFLMIQDVTELALYEKKLADLAKYDALTGIYNRGYLDTRLEAEFERHQRYGRAMSVILVDVDHFKFVNDEYGHKAGDEVLKQLAVLLETHLRSTDIIARYGGEEFFILLPESGVMSAEEVAEKARSLVEEEKFCFSGDTIGITVSAGVASLSDGVSDYDALVEAADKALYLAKAAGRNRVAVDTASAEGISRAG